MNEREYSANWLFIALFVAAVAAAVFMYTLGNRAKLMPEHTRQMNKLLRDQTIYCSDKSTARQCREAIDAIEEYKKVIAEDMARKKRGQENQ